MGSVPMSAGYGKRLQVVPQLLLLPLDTAGEGGEALGSPAVGCCQQCRNECAPH